MKEVELREDEYVCIRKDTYDRLLDIETRVDVLVVYWQQISMSMQNWN